MDAEIIFEQFMAQLKTYEESLENIKTLSDEFDNEEENVLKLDRIVELMIQRRIYEHNEELMKHGAENAEEHEENKRILLDVTDLLMEKNSLANKIYSTMYIEEKDESISVNSEIPGLIHFIKKRSEDNKGFKHIDKNQIELRSIIINLCITFESFLSQLLKEFYLNDPHTNLKSKKTITFEELLIIDDMDSAKNFLIDQQLDDLFRKNFNTWYKEICESFNIDSKTKIVKEKIDSITEMYERRNLFVHANGIVNGQYLKNVPNSSYKEGETVSIENNYLKNKIKDIEHLCWITFDSFLKRQYKDNTTSFSAINSLLLKYIKRKCEAIPQIYKSYYERNNMDEGIKIIAKVNYFLYYKFNGGLENYKEKVDKFPTSHLAKEFKVAKAILIDDPYCLEIVSDFINEIDESRFFEMVDWPLFKAGENKSEIIDLLNIRLKEIIEDDINEAN